MIANSNSITAIEQYATFKVRTLFAGAGNSVSLCCLYGVGWAFPQSQYRVACNQYAVLYGDCYGHALLQRPCRPFAARTAGVLLNPFAHATSLIGGSFGQLMLCGPLISAAILLLLTAILGALSVKRWYSSHAAEKLGVF